MISICDINNIFGGEAKNHARDSTYISMQIDIFIQTRNQFFMKLRRVYLLTEVTIEAKFTSFPC